MVQRRYGPSQAPGVGIIEKEPERAITPAALGVTCYLGITEKGEVGKLNTCLTKQSFTRQMGGRIADSLLPDTVQDFFDAGFGAGRVYVVRATDGSEVQSEISLKNRAAVRANVITVKAKNGGSWGGKKDVFFADVVTYGTDIDETVLRTKWQPAIDIPEDKYKGGTLTFMKTSQSYTIIASNKATSSVELELTVTADSTMKTDCDFGAAEDYSYTVELTNESKALSLEVGDGELKPTTEFSMKVYVDGELKLNYPNLNMDPVEANYFERVINDDAQNYEIAVTDLVTGARTASSRPATHYGVNKAIAATQLTYEASVPSYNAGNTGNGVVGTFLYGTEVKPQTITLECTSGGPTGTFTVKSSIAPLDDMTDSTSASAYAVPLPFMIGFTITDGATPWAIGDFIYIDVRPFEENALIGGKLYPCLIDANVGGKEDRRVYFQITANTETTITIGAGEDLTQGGDFETGDTFMVVAPEELPGGYDGIAEIGDADYTALLNVSTSPINELADESVGLLKMATPGVTATAVMKAGLAYAEAKNYQFREETPQNVTTPVAAETWVNDTVGRNDFGVAAFPSFASVSDPDGEGLKTVSLTGMIHGREAMVARNYGGYHKAGAGIDVTLPRVLKLPYTMTPADEEFLNPQGIQIIKIRQGNAIVWGDRTISIDPGWKWKHQREQMSYYEHVLQESFDWIIFAIHNPETRDQAITALRAFFLVEYANKSLDTNYRFDEAVTIKCDLEINPPEVRASGDLYCEIGLRLPDTVERFIMTVSKRGLFESIE